MALGGESFCRARSRLKKQVLVEHFIAHPTVEAFHKAVLRGLARRDVIPGDANSSAQLGLVVEVNSVPLTLDNHAKPAAAGEQGRELAPLAVRR